MSNNNSPIAIISFSEQNISFILIINNFDTIVRINFYQISQKKKKKKKLEYFFKTTFLVFFFFGK